MAKLKAAKGVTLVTVEALKVLISLSGMNQRELAGKCGMTESQVSEYLSGEVGIGPVAIAKFSIGLQIAPDLIAQAEGISLEDVRSKIIDELAEKAKIAAKPPTLAEPHAPLRLLPPPAILPADLIAATMLEMPIIGRVAAGTPVLADETVEGHFDLPESLVKELKVVFLLKIRGDSMEGLGLKEGVLAMVAENPSPPLGSIVVATTSLAETVCKAYVVNDANEPVLRAFPDYEPNPYADILVDDETHIHGVVVGLTMPTPKLTAKGRKKT